MTEINTLVAHEWIAEVGGSENVFEQLLLTVHYSRAMCLWNDNPARFPDVQETWLGRSPLRGHKAAAMPFMGSAWHHIDLKDTERVIVSSHAFAHHLASRAAAAGIPSFAYVHSPARYVWAPELDDRGNTLVGRLGRSFFRRWDRSHAARDVHYAANSQFVASRIANAWGIEARVVYPPVDIDRIRSFDGDLCESDMKIAQTLPAEFVLGASRFVSYKNLDAAIVAGEVCGLPVVLVGSGPDEPRLRGIAERAQTSVIFTGTVSERLLLQLYRRAALLVYMAIEDFGIMPVEAMASGTPVLVNDVGGARESVLAVGGGLASTWHDRHFGDASVVEAALGVDLTKAQAEVVRFSTSSFKEHVQWWLRED